MAKLLLIVFFIVPICVLCLAFVVLAERMMREEAARRVRREQLVIGGLSRRELQAATKQAMRTDARLAQMRKSRRMHGRRTSNENLDTAGI